MNRGLYGQAEGNENRNATAVLEDHLRDNEIIEGEYRTPLENFAKKGDLTNMARLRDKMKKDYIAGGVPADLAQSRADSALSSAMRYLKV